MDSPTLDDVLAYENPEVVQKFRRLYAVSEQEAEEIFMETKKWLWFAAHSTVPATISKGMWIIDEMWHTFITFTMDYLRFCEDSFGRFIHHAPVSPRSLADDQRAFESDPEAFQLRQAERMRAEFAEIRRLLGEDTLRRWQVDFRQRYSPEVCQILAIQSLSAELVAFREQARDTGERLAFKTDIMVDGSEPLEDQIIEALIHGGQNYPRCDIMCGNCNAGCSGICLTPVRPRP